MAGKSARKVKNVASPEARLTWLTRQRAAARLGLSISGIRNLVRFGQLEEHKDPTTGKPLYEARAVDAALLRRPPRRSSSGGKKGDAEPDPGELSARAFALFGQDIDLRRAVVELKITAAEAEQLAQDYTRLGRELLVSADGVKEVVALLGGHAIATEADLVAALHERVRRQAATQREEIARAVAPKDAEITELRAQLAAVERERNELRTRAETLAAAVLQAEMSKHPPAATAPAPDAAGSSGPAPSDPAAPPASKEREPG